MDRMGIINVNRKDRKISNFGCHGINAVRDRGKRYTSIRNRRFYEKSGSCVAIVSVLSEARKARNPKSGSWDQPCLRNGKDSWIIQGNHMQNFLFLMTETVAVPLDEMEF